MDLTALWPSLEALVLERLPDGRFVARNGVPAWCGHLRPEAHWDSPFLVQSVFPFLTVFLPTAEQAWWGDPPFRAESDFWTEADGDGEGDLHLLAYAVSVRQAQALVILRSDQLFFQSQGLLQRGRELRLVHASLMKEMEQKDILIHAIVHDLVAPLHTIIGVLSLLEEKTAEAGKSPEPWLELAITAANRQQTLIREVLDVFTAEVSALVQASPEGVDLSSVIDRVLEERGPVARSRGVRFDCDAKAGDAYVVAEEMRLFRVLTNLVDNALRYSPEGGVIRISTYRGDGTVAVTVEDQGPGVPHDLLPRLFEKLARGRDREAGSGLGLFFCRITIEDWGGAIGYDPGESGGSKFWIRLKCAFGADDCGRERSKEHHGEAAHAGR
jgi:signal transduction histidine kinase